MSPNARSDFINVSSSICLLVCVSVCESVCVSEALIRSTLAEGLSDLSPVAQVQVLTMKQKLR